MPQVPILMVDDDEDDFVLVRDLLETMEPESFRLDWVADFDEALAELEKGGHDVYLVDYRLGPRNGLDLLREAVRRGCRKPIILLTGQDDRKIDVEAMGAGAADYLVKGQIDAQVLERSIRYAQRHKKALNVLSRAVHENSMMAAAINNLTTGVVITDATQPVPPILYVNPAFCRISGYAPSELLGQTTERLFGADTDRGEIEKLRQAARDAQSATVLLRCYRKDGSPFWNEVTLNPLFDSRSKLANFVELQNDVTLRTEVQQMKLEKEAAERANRAKSQFLAQMSHELRTPLNSVIGFTNVLLKNRDGRFSEKEISALSRIRNNGEHLLKLIDEILDLSRIESGRAEAARETVIVEDLIRDTIEQFQVQTANRKVTLKTELPPESAPIEGDEAKLRQILFNLVGNALKFTEEGCVKVCLEIDPTSRKPLKIEVSDTGPGIPADQLDNVLQPFQQADSSISRRFGGSGLGLSICQSLCQLLGYELRVQSQVGKGSTFSVIL